jgi:signal transduction histidine kinase/DNA-binding response OmpR family regulator
MQLNGNSFRAVTAMHKGIDDTLWVADATQVSSIDTQGKVQHFSLPDAEIAANKVVLSIVQDYREDVWISLNHRGLLRLRPSTGQFEEVKPIKEQQLQSWSRIWLKIAPSRESLLYIKSTNGYGVYDIVNERLSDVYKTTALQFDYEQKHPLNSADVWMVDNAHSDDTIVMSSNKGFFIVLDTTGKNFTRMVPDNIHGIVGVVSDSENQHVYWLASTLGQLYRWDARTNEHQAYGQLEGLPASGIAHEQGIMLAVGTILWGSQAGLVTINDRQNDTNVYKPSVVLNRFDLNYVEQKTGQSGQFDGPVARISELKLDYQHNSLQFGFFSSSFAAPHNNRYQYRMIGLHQDWIESDTLHRKARFINLSPGHYIFEVKASNSHGIFSDVHQIKVEITPPLWRSWWAYVGYLLAVLYWLFFRAQKKKNQTKLLEKKVSLRTKELVKNKELVELLMREREHLVENIYHQTRTPLQIMLGNISALEGANLEIAGFCEQQRNEIFKLTHLTDQVLDVSKVTESPKSVINISSILTQLAVGYRDIAKHQNLILNWHIQENLFTCCSPMSIEKAFDNVLSNAVKYTNEGEICFTAEHCEDEIIIRCIDSGIGIPKQDLEFIGERYVRANNVENRLGSGIGLTMITDVVAAHKGKFDIQSKVNEGTELTIRLKAEVVIAKVDDERKLKAQQVLQSLSRNVGVNVDSNGEKPVVLIAEDNLELASYITAILLKHYHVINALSGEEALVKAREAVPNLILSDVMMGTLDGFKLVQSIRQCDICCHIPVILLTAKSDDFSREYGYQVGANDFINKPFKETDLKHRINNQLQLVTASQQQFTRSQPKSVTHVDVDLDIVSEDRLVMRFLSFVTENYAQSELQTKDMCEQLHISNRQLERKVKHFLNVSPKQFLNEFRLSRAKECIDRDESISKVYGKCGFSSHTYFTKKFKDKYAMTPSDYKKTTRDI